MTQHCRFLISLLTYIKLNEKEGIQSTSVRTKDSEILIVPMWVTEAYCPLGNLMNLEIAEVILVKNNMEHIMWSVAPISMIQEVLVEFMSEDYWVKDKKDAKTECFESRA